MSATHEGETAPNGSARSSLAAKRAAIDDSAGAQFRELFGEVEDLIKRVADIESPDVQKIRAKVRVALKIARSALEDGAVQVRRQAARAAATTDNYLREYPWQALGIGTLLGFGIGILVARRD